MSEIAGRVLMIPKGTYSPTTTYDPLDAVKYGQNSYVCKQTSRGNLPTNTTYWQPLTDVTADEIPTEGSTNLVQSGGVYSALKDSVTWDNLSEVGAVNDFNNTATTKTVNGVTYTVNDDKSITVNSTNGATSDYTLLQINFKVQKTGQYKVLLDKLGTSQESIYYNIESIAPSPSARITRSYDGNEIITLTKGVQYTFFIYCRLNVPITNKVIYPFFTSLLDYNGPYVPYAKTNRELTDDGPTVKTINVTAESEVGFSSTTTFKQCGKNVILNFHTSLSIAANTEVLLFTLPEGSRPSARLVFPAFNANSDGIVGFMIIKANGEVSIASTQATTAGAYYGGIAQFFAS